MPSNKEPAPRPLKKNTVRKTTPRPTIRRIFMIIGALLNHQRHGTKVTRDTLAAELEVDRATISRDLEFAREIFQISIEWDHRACSYIVDKDLKDVPALTLSEMDYILLAYIEQCLEPYADTELGRVMMKSYAHMFGIFTGTKKVRNWASTVSFRGIESTATPTMELRTFNILTRAIHERRIVQFTYKSPGKPAPSSKAVEPHHMSMKRGRWYFHATDTRNRKLGTYAFIRVKNLEITDRRFPDHPSPHPRDLLRHSLGIAIGNEPPAEVVLEFAPQVVERLKESVWTPDQRITDLPGGGARLTLHLNSTIELEPWLLSWGPNVRVVSPPAIAARHAATIRDMTSIYPPSPA